jgi:hypothetical protein
MMPRNSCIRSGDRVRKVAIVEEIRTLDQDEEVLELLGGDGAEADVAVGGGFDRRHLDGARRSSHVGPAEEIGEHRRERVHRHRHALEERDVDVLTAARLSRLPPRRDGSHRRIRAPDPLTEPAARRKRWTFGCAARAGRPAPRLQRELRRGAGGPRAAETER